MSRVRGNRLEGLRILIAGATGAIGSAVASLASSEGANCILWARDEGKLVRQRNSLFGQGHDFSSLDVRDAGQIARAIQSAQETHGGLDALVYSVGLYSLSPINRLRPEELEAIVQTNLTAALLTCQGFLKICKSRSNPSITFIGSVASQKGEKALSAYSASKGGIDALTLALASELGSRRIRVNSISPGPIKSEMVESQNQKTRGLLSSNLEGRFPLGVGSAKDVAEAVLFLTSSSARWITGANLKVDGGYSL